MGIITLTDRISVSVRAKNETESNSQKRATGKNIANALGNGNISDSLADQLGNTSKPTIADEQGREWVAMSDIIAAGKKMQKEGAFEEKTMYGPVTVIPVTSLPLSKAKDVGWLYGPFCMVYGSGSMGDLYRYISAGPGNDGDGPVDLSGYYIGYVVSEDSNNNLSVYDVFEPPNSNGNVLSQRYAYNVPSIDPDKSYYYEFNGRQGSFPSNGSDYDTNLVGLNGMPKTYTKYHGHRADDYGSAQKSGGSLIDWTKPDDEIEEDIRNLHETWDVSDHAGSTTANGTYVLAGPIEFNPGD